MLEERALVAPRFGYRVWPVERAEGARIDLGEVVLEAPGLAASCAAASAVAAAACTLGDALEERVRALWRQGRRLVALELDEAANKLLYCLSRAALAAIRRDAARRGDRAGDELNPGDPGLALGEQAVVLRLAAARDQGIVATGGGMLSPVKSLSFVVALGPGLAPRAGGRCRRCPARERCRARPD